MPKKIKLFIKTDGGQLLGFLLIIDLVSWGSFILGKQSVSSEKPLIVYKQAGQENKDIPPPPGMYVASKTGTKYYLPWCGTAVRILEGNKVWFDSKEEAEEKGYEPASNCKGI